MGSVEQIHPVNGSTSWIERLAGAVGGSVRAQTVYGQPIEREGITVIPVARISYGFGGGGGASASAEHGEGGGGAGQARPVGFISVRDGAAEFRSIPDPAADARRVLVLVAGAGLAAWLLLRGIRGLLR